MELPRRHFLLLISGALLQPVTDRVQRDMVVRSVRPEDLEMPLSGFSDYITPIDHFFVRTHVYTPRVTTNEWRLTVDGAVATPLTLTMDDVRRLPVVELVGVLECAGNGRGFYEPSVPGLQWANGAVGNARWRGVRLVDVLKRAGVKESAKEVLFNGADVPLGTMPDFQRSIPIGKALDGRTLLAYEMNGETLPVEHGFPMRVVAPGWAGDCWIKWLTSISVLDKAHDGFWMTRAYRHPGKAVAPGTVVPPEQMQPVTSLRVKSVIAAPLDGSQMVNGKPVTIRGVAWSGDAGPLTAVDVSVDGGRNWKPATLRRDQRTEFGWRQWEYGWTPSREAYYTILARARDGASNTQPFDQEWNPSGYAWNVVPRVGVNVVTELSDTRQRVQPEAVRIAPPAAFKNACVACHDDDVIQQQRLTRGQWDLEVNKMIGWGARVNNEDRRALLDYLFGNFGPRP
ncbi:MAG TPA: molybdopterin-dependent oxidoreductase, partial [Vicinamibacterales bacterium]|nr:molybdopterin-dependent oxidoreductase [Vicinamibacterales bacterium]